MSVKVTSWVWDNSPYEGKQLLIHLAFADWAGDDGFCWPNQETIARKCRCSVETVRTTTRQMEQDGLIQIVEVSKGKGSSHKYRLLSPKSFGPNGASSPKSTGRTPQIHGDLPPNPSPSNHQEPSLEPPVGKYECPYCHMWVHAGKKHFCSALRQEF